MTNSRPQQEDTPMGLIVMLFAALLALPRLCMAEDQLLPAGMPLVCTMQERNFSLKTAEENDPTLCYLPPVMGFGQPLFPRGSYLTGRLADGTPPGRLWGKGSLTIEFDRLVLPSARLPISVKVIAVPKFKVSRDGKILGKGHAKRDAAEWVLPPLWPLAVAELPRRGPWPAIKGKEERLVLRVMQDVMVPAVDQGLAYYSPPFYASPEQQGQRTHVNPVRDGGDVVLVRKDGSSVLCQDYWVEVPGYISYLMAGDMPGQRFGRVAIDSLDMKETVRVNRERGIEFRKPRPEQYLDGPGGY
jgi:hypothetical protein